MIITEKNHRTIKSRRKAVPKKIKNQNSVNSTAGQLAQRTLVVKQIHPPVLNTMEGANSITTNDKKEQIS